MSLKPKELAEQDTAVIKYFFLVFVPIFLVIIGLVYVRNNSVQYLEDEYYKVHYASYSGIITNLYNDQSKNKVRVVSINNNLALHIPFYIHEQLSVGDSIVKKKNSDIEYYILQNGNRINNDINDFNRKRYFEKLNPE
ncbi:hypothetical protein [Kordia jejudonensis]|uniref:hypothetical protein n=1 Tax=Kordia jejudonensis TaxID=1348245 RepID=UPI0006297E8C|nr:hypothetical protein [Kordia jejudonensis]